MPVQLFACHVQLSPHTTTVMDIISTCHNHPAHMDLHMHTHQPTGIVVACQNGRSQHQNRATAWEMLRSRLYEMELQKRMAEQQESHDAKTEIGWGHQIRSYVLQPYQMVKDLRTEVETSDTSGVLDGDIDRFLSASLSHALGSDG